MRFGRAACVLVAGMMLAPLVTAPPASAAASATEIDARMKLLDIINNKRVAKGLGVAQEFAVATDEAQDHSQSMKKRGRIDHKGFQQRFNAIKAADAGMVQACENVAFVSGVANKNRAMKMIYKGWKRSAPHRKCMFDKNFTVTDAGIGVERKGRRTWYATFIALRDTT